MSTHRSMGDIVGRDPRDVGLSPSLRGGGGGPMGGGGPPKGGPGGGGPLRGGPFIIPIKQEKNGSIPKLRWYFDMISKTENWIGYTMFCWKFISNFDTCLNLKIYNIIV